MGVRNATEDACVVSILDSSDPQPMLCVCGMCAIHKMCCGRWCIDPQPMLGFGMCTIHIMSCGCWCIDPQPILCVCVPCVPYIPCAVGVGASTHSPTVCVWLVYHTYHVLWVLVHRPTAHAVCVCGMCTIHTMCCGCWCIDPQLMLCVWHVYHTYHVLWVLVIDPQPMLCVWHVYHTYHVLWI